MSEPAKELEKTSNLKLFPIKLEHVNKSELLADDYGQPLEISPGVFQGRDFTEVYQTETGYSRPVPDTIDGVLFAGTGKVYRDPAASRQNEIANVSYVAEVKDRAGQAFVAKSLPWSPATNAEADRLLSLNHPNILKVKTLAMSDPDKPLLRQVFMIAEKVEGENLENWLAKNPPFADVKNVFIRLADAVTYLHEQDLIHGDLSPYNILISADQPKIIDFGIAKKAAGQQIVLGQGLGTRFSPIEQAEGSFSKKGDIYSLGMILYSAIAVVDEDKFLGEAADFLGGSQLKIKSVYKTELEKRKIEIGMVIRRAIAPKIEDRKYASANDFMANFIQALT